MPQRARSHDSRLSSFTRFGAYSFMAGCPRHVRRVPTHYHSTARGTITASAASFATEPARGFSCTSLANICIPAKPTGTYCPLRHRAALGCSLLHSLPIHIALGTLLSPDRRTAPYNNKPPKVASRCATPFVVRRTYSRTSAILPHNRGIFRNDLRPHRLAQGRAVGGSFLTESKGNFPC